jgi:Fur family ferric uptake transcriptional regulator
VAEVLHGDHVHLSAEAVHGLAQQRLPEISLATVYNTLNELVSLGEVQEVAAGEGPKRYDPKVGERHQHLLCVRCNELLDVVPHGEAQLGLSSVEQHGYEMLDVKLLFRGVCPSCRSVTA